MTLHKHELSLQERIQRDWKIMLITFVVLLLAVFAFDGYLLVRVNRGDFFLSGNTSAENINTIDRKVLLDASNFFDERQKEYEAFQNSGIVEIDPSL